MRKLLAAGIVAAGSLGVSGQANAESTIYEIAGTFGSNEQGCTQITLLFGGSDCSFGRNRAGAAGTWIGPLFSGAHYVPDGIKDVIGYVPTSGGFASGPTIETSIFSPAADDGKYAAPITGNFTIDDNGTAGDPTDDLISANFSIGAMARNIATGQNTRAIQRWTTMDHVMAAIPVNATETVANGAGGVDYLIGSRGFPAPLCSATNGTDCFPTANSSAVFTNFTSPPDPDGPDGPLPAPDGEAVSFWAQIATGGIGIERTGLMGDPAFVLVQPPPNPPTGNVGAQTIATFTGYSCDDSQVNDLDCNSNALIWQGNVPSTGGETPGFDNMIMKISTNGAGEITSAFVYWTQEYAIGFGGPPPGYDNSWQGGSLSFTGVEQSLAPNARDFAVNVLENSAGNTLDTVANSVNFTDPVTITIVTLPAAGTAMVNGDQTIDYNATGVGPGVQTLVYEATDGTDTDQGTITITVAADVAPVAPDGTITISTQGAAPGAATVGQVNVTTLPGFSPGNGLVQVADAVSITTAPDAAAGTATATGTTIRFTPAATFFTGNATIGYTVVDIDGDEDTGVITVTVTDVTPVINDGTITTDQDRASSALALGITPGNGSVAQHTLAVTASASSGTCSISGTSLTYTPNAEFFGTDSCVVTLTDGDGDTDTGTISITVNEVSNQLILPGGGSAFDPWSLALLGALPLLRRRRRG